MGFGYNGRQEGSCYTGREHAIYQWKLSSTLWGAHINTATVNATEIYSAACSSSYTVNLHWSGGIGSGTDWSNRPGYNSYSTSASYARAYNGVYCPSNGSVTHGLNVYTPISRNAAGHASTLSATLSEDSAESSHDDGGFSRFSHNPSLEIFYNLIPSNPSKSTMSAVSSTDDAACDTTSPYPYMGKTIATTPPVLKAKVSDPDGDKLQAAFRYWINGSSTKYTGLSGDNLSSGSYAGYSLPSSFIIIRPTVRCGDRSGAERRCGPVRPRPVLGPRRRGGRGSTGCPDPRTHLPARGRVPARTGPPPARPAR